MLSVPREKCSNTSFLRENVEGGPDPDEEPFAGVPQVPGASLQVLASKDNCRVDV